MSDGLAAEQTEFFDIALVHMPGVSRALAKGDPVLAYKRLSAFMPRRAAGRALVELCRTQHGWAELVRKWSARLDGRQLYRARRTNTWKDKFYGKPLSLRDLQLLEAMANGERMTETAGRLRTTTFTVQDQRKKLLAKLGARDAAHAVHLAHQQGHLRA